jgi:hypothetical protein
MMMAVLVPRGPLSLAGGAGSTQHRAKSSPWTGTAEILAALGTAGICAWISEEFSQNCAEA